MKKIKVKKIFLGLISIRNYIIEKAIKKKEGLIVKFQNQEMTLRYEQLKNGSQFHRHKFKSKYENKEYELIDFKFIPDETNQMRLF